jgi:hypothetical protein
MEHVREELSAYCLRELPAREARRVDEHLTLCEACRREWEEVRVGVELARRMKAADAPVDLWHSVEAGLGERAFPVWKVAAALVATAAVAAVVLWPRPELGPVWNVTRLAGEPELAGRRMEAEGKLARGQRVVTDGASRVQINVGDIGRVQVEGDSRVKLVDGGANQHRLSLEKGKLSAFIWAPPGQFYVDTASAVAVDLGCAYTLETTEEGRGVLEVTSGWVAFEWKGRESFVPAGARCVTRPRMGPGTPYFKDASSEFSGALERFDESPINASDPFLGAVLGAARERDAFTLWHLLGRTSGAERGKVYDRLAMLVPPPSGATREAVVRGERRALDQWWDGLGLGTARWWRGWKGMVPGTGLQQ